MVGSSSPDSCRSPLLSFVRINCKSNQMKLVRKEIGIIQIKSHVDIDFEYDFGYHEYFAHLQFVDDDPRRWDFNKLSDLKRSSHVLESLVELKEFDDSIKIEFNGDRGGEYFSITIKEKVMVEIAEKFGPK